MLPAPVIRVLRPSYLTLPRPDEPPHRIPLTRLPQFIPDHASQRSLQRLLCRGHVSDQCLVDQALIARATRFMRFAAEPVQYSVVQPDRDPGLPRFGRRHRPSFRFGKVILCFHFCSSYCRRSPGLAGRAEINRTTVARQVQTTTNKSLSLPFPGSPTAPRLPTTHPA